MELTERQEKIIEIVKNNAPITGEQIADRLRVTRAALRPDLTVLTMSGILEARPRVGYFYNERTINSLVGERLSQIRVKDVKSRPVVVREDDTIYDAIVTLFLEDVGSLFVVGEEGFLEGVVSRKDLLKNTLGQVDIHRIPIGVVMTRMPNIITVTPDDTVFTAAKKLIDHEIDSMPVVRTYIDSNGKERLEIVGRLTKTNITRLFVELVGQG
ncbi:MAG: helix-turn-helix transcriptional regulator [Firmicutes bacterium]|nr:helix-turn-helix transcriptional regulator [Bacillota bacterium]